MTDEIQLPNGSVKACFDKNDFIKDDFNVYQFVNECRRKVPLETVRDDLNTYLSILRNAMIELINKDYADFVNLSTNLVGLEKMINNLVVPVGQLKEEILSVKMSMDEVVTSTKEKLERKQNIRERKVCLQHLMNISLCVNKIEELLHIEPGIEESGIKLEKELNGVLMERVAVEFNQLHFHVTKSKGHAFVEQIKPRIVSITRVLQNNLEAMFLAGVQDRNIEKLRQCLRIYATIDRMKEVENLFRKHIVKPFMDEVIHEEKFNSVGLERIYEDILAFIPKHCEQLKTATIGNENTLEAIHGYDFVINSVWPEFVSNVEVRLTCLFAPSNTSRFHKRYTITMQFLEKLEKQCGSQESVKRLREHPSYVNFMNKWNLPVYFQIKFQDIAGNLETALLSPWDLLKEENNDFNLRASQILWTNMHICWSTDVYLYQLCHRFWKLTLQLVSRYCYWVQMVVQNELQVTTSTSSDSGISSDSTSDNQDNQKPSIPLSDAILLVSDIQILNPKLLSFCSDTVQPQLIHLGFDDVRILRESMQEFQEILTKQIPLLATYVTESVSMQCGNSLKLVGDIPRLYRRTNKEAPTKPSTYVSNILQPLQNFLEQQKNNLNNDVRSEWGMQILGHVTQQYHKATSNVLISVKKMEESLSRLKKARDKGNVNVVGSTSGITDDDKIRLQLSLDVHHYGKLIDDMNYDKSKVEFYQELVDMIEAARTSPNR